MFPLNITFNRFIKTGHLKVTDFYGQEYEFGDISSSLHSEITLHRPETGWNIALYPALKIGEAYCEKSLTVDSGSLLDFFQLLIVNNRRWNNSLTGHLFYQAEDLFRLPSVLNRISRSRYNVRHHYDLSDELFSLFLDSDRQYSCAYFRNPSDSLELAQLNKRQHIAAKLALKSGLHVLDIGSGWGGLSLYLAQHYPVRVTGLTLSEEQYKVSNARAHQLGLEDRVTFKLQDYREETGIYDRVVSVGMFEHVGRPYFKAFFRKLDDLLKPDGSALIHTIGSSTPPCPINPWLRRNIFPGAYLPSLSQLMPILERQGLWLTDLENLRLHYALTLSHWHDRFQANREHIARLYDERFCRMWEFYLKSCEAGFRWSGLTVFQMQLSKNIDALPITRDYIMHEESRLRQLSEHEGEQNGELSWQMSTP